MPGGPANYLCSSDVPVVWHVNDELVDSNNNHIVTSEFDNGIGYLYFENISSELNESTVRCDVMSSGVASSFEDILLLQGN